MPVCRRKRSSRWANCAKFFARLACRSSDVKERLVKCLFATLRSKSMCLAFCHTRRKIKGKHERLMLRRHGLGCFFEGALWCWMSLCVVGVACEGRQKQVSANSKTSEINGWVSERVICRPFLRCHPVCLCEGWCISNASVMLIIARLCRTLCGRNGSLATWDGVK